MIGDEELVGQIRQGDMAAFEALYRRYERRLFGYILRLVSHRAQAEDLFQEVFMRVLRDQTFDLQEGRFAGWLFKVARNHCLTYLRNAGGRAEKLRSAARSETPPAGAPSPEEQAQQRQAADALDAALAGLSEPHQQAFILKQLAELTYREIAEIQGVPEGTVKSRLHFAVRAVQQNLATQGGVT